MIVIDAGVTLTRFYDVAATDPRVTIGDIDLPCVASAGGVVAEFPGDATKEWPATTGVAVLTALVDGERVEVQSEPIRVTRATADRAALREAVRDAITRQEAYAGSTPEEAVAHVESLAADVAWIGRALLEAL